MGQEWDQPSFEGAGKDFAWVRPAPRAHPEVVRVVWHGEVRPVWVDPVYEDGQPDIVLGTAIDVAVARL